MSLSGCLSLSTVSYFFISLCMVLSVSPVFAELLRKSAEHTLVDMVQLLFSR